MTAENKPAVPTYKNSTEFQKAVIRLSPAILSMLASCQLRVSADAGTTVDDLARSANILSSLQKLCCGPAGMVAAGIIGATLYLGKRWLDAGTVKKPKHWDNKKR